MDDLLQRFENAEALAWISEPHDNLLRDLRFAFEEHWGRHAVDVLRPLHLLASAA